MHFNLFATLPNSLRYTVCITHSKKRTAKLSDLGNLNFGDIYVLQFENLETI